MAYAIPHPDGTVCTCRQDVGGSWSPSQVITNAARAVSLSAKRRAERRMLLELDDRLLADIGITRQQARHEASKSFCLWTDATTLPVRSAQ